MARFFIYAAQPNTVATSYMSLLSTEFFILTLSSDIWLVATTLDSTALGFTWIYFQLLAAFFRTLYFYLPL